MSLPQPADPGGFSERLPVRLTVVVDRDTGEGVTEAVSRALCYTDLSAAEARRVILQAVRAARAGDVLTVASVRVAVR